MSTSKYINIHVRTEINTIDTLVASKPNEAYVFISKSKYSPKDLIDNGHLLRQYKSIQVAKKNKLYVYFCIDRRVTKNTETVICKVEPYATYSTFYFYYNNLWSKINIGIIPGMTNTHYINLIDQQKLSTNIQGNTSSEFNLKCDNIHNQVKNNKLIFYQTADNEKEIMRYNPEFNNLLYTNTYASFVDSIVKDDLRLSMSFIDYLNFYNEGRKTLLTGYENIKIDIFPESGDKQIFVTNFNDDKIHMNLAYYDRAINFYCQMEIAKAMKQAIALNDEKTQLILKGGAGSMGGHVGAFCFVKDSNGDIIMYKKYAGDKLEDEEEIINIKKKIGFAVNFNESADRELLFYWRLLKLHNYIINIININKTSHSTSRYAIVTSTPISTKYIHLIQLYKYSSLPLLSDSKQIKLIAHNKTGLCTDSNVNKSFKQGYEVGNMFKDITNIDKNYRGILDFKLGAYTKLLTDKDLSDDIEYTKDELNYEQYDQYGGVKIKDITDIKYAKVIAQLILDANSTSTHYGFRCEALGSPAEKLFFPSDAASTDAYFYKNGKNGFVTESYTSMKPSEEYNANKELYHKHKGTYYSLNKPKIYESLNDIYNKIKDKIGDKPINPLPLAHFLHVNPFNMDNNVIIDFVKSKPEKEKNRPLYSLPPILILHEFIGKLDDKDKYWEKIYDFCDALFVSQYRDYINDSLNQKNPPVYFCFVGSSVMMRYVSAGNNTTWDTDKIRFFLSDFGHPYMFDKTFKEEGKKTKDVSYPAMLDFTFKNFIFGGLAFLYMNYLALCALDFKFSEKYKQYIDTVEKYLHRLINELLYDTTQSGAELTAPVEFESVKYDQDKVKDNSLIYTLIQPSDEEYIKYKTEKNRLLIDKVIYESKYDKKTMAENTTD